ncbi:MAG: hypothetical protein ACI80K_002417, partial [Paracoccaceae bacterium]
RGGAGERSWFTGVLFNSARVVFRRQSRDRTNAPVTVREPMAPATDDVVAELQLREQVAHALLQLDEPYRTTLHMRYITGQQVKEIAAKMGVASSTVTERVERGLVMLRGDLDRMGPKGRHGWLAPMMEVAARADSAGAGIGSAVGAAMLLACLLGAAWGGIRWYGHRTEVNEAELPANRSVAGLGYVAPPGERDDPLIGRMGRDIERRGGFGRNTGVPPAPRPSEPAMAVEFDGAVEPPAQAQQSAVGTELLERRVRVTEGGLPRANATLSMMFESGAQSALGPPVTDHRGWATVRCAPGTHTFTLLPKGGVGERKTLNVDWPLPEGVTVIDFP